MTEGKSYDLFVIGAGPGGYTAALLGAGKGLRVGIAEGAHFGGTCTNTGCIPTKSYIESVNLYSRIKGSRRFGIDAGPFTLTMENLHKRKSRVVARLAKGIEYLLSRGGVDIWRGYARVLDRHTVQVGDDRIEAASLVIATGSRPKRPRMFSLPEVLTSEEVFDLKRVPASLVIVGGGVIGMEMAHIFSSLGAEVTVVEALDRILATEDREASDTLVSVYRQVRFITSARVASVSQDTAFHLDVESPSGMETVHAEALLLCIGREPVLPEGIDALGVERTSSGGILVDLSMRSSTPGVYAIGDVTGKYMYAYVASKEAEVAVDSIVGGSQAMDYSAVPSVVFTDPEIASVGAMPGTGLIKGTFPVSALGRARTMEASDGFASVYCSEGGRMARVTIVSPHATELVSWATLAVAQGLTIDEFLRPAYPHPTMAELLKEAADDAAGHSVNKP